MTAVAPLYTVPISERPRQPWRRTFSAVLFFLVFNLGCVMINASQFVFLLPLRLLPFKWSRALYVDGIRYTKGAFGCLLSTSPNQHLPSIVALSVPLSPDMPVVCADKTHCVIRDNGSGILYSGGHRSYHRKG